MRQRSKLATCVNSFDIEDEWGGFNAVFIVTSLILAVIEEIVALGICIAVPLMRIVFEGPEVLKTTSPARMREKRKREVQSLWDFYLEPVDQAFDVQKQN